MLDDSGIENQIYDGIMALIENIRDSYGFSSNSLSASLFGSNGMENRRFELMANNRGHMEPQRMSSRRRRSPRNDKMVFCRYCPNKMPASNMAGKVLIFFKRIFRDFFA